MDIESIFKSLDFDIDTDYVSDIYNNHKECLLNKKRTLLRELSEYYSLKNEIDFLEKVIEKHK